ncbi:MAG: hypothetical protein NVSMB21_23900 [Vulcanimicrobiaceae bacterium]
MNKSNTSNTVDVVADILIAPVTAYLATHVMGSVRMGLYKRESEAERAREDAVRPGPPYELNAKETLGVLGSPVDGKTLELERERDVAIRSNEKRCVTSKMRVVRALRAWHGMECSVEPFARRSQRCIRSAMPTNPPIQRSKRLESVGSAVGRLDPRRASSATYAGFAFAKRALGIRDRRLRRTER